MTTPLVLGLARGAHMAGCYTLFGTILLIAFLLPAGTAPTLRRLTWGSLFLALAGGLAWFLLQSADMASAGNLNELLGALPIVIESTRFGHLLVLRCGLACLAMLGLCAGWPRAAAVAAGITVVAQAWLDHGGAMTGPAGTELLIAGIVHLGFGAAWIGSLPGLFIIIAGASRGQAAKLARRYSPAGMACVLGLIASAALQFFVLIKSPAALFTTLYGRVVLLKILLLCGLILLAAINRYRLSPALSDPGRDGPKTNLLISIGFEIALGVTAILAAGWLLNLTPPSMAMMLQPP